MKVNFTYELCGVLLACTADFLPYPHAGLQLAPGGIVARNPAGVIVDTKNIYFKCGDEKFQSMDMSLRDMAYDELATIERDVAPVTTVA